MGAVWRKFLFGAAESRIQLPARPVPRFEGGFRKLWPPKVTFLISALAGARRDGQSDPNFLSLAVIFKASKACLLGRRMLLVVVVTEF